jgi:low molecular weight protein-tyrosine phosphatase
VSAPEFELVFLCTGNQFRSPLAEAVLRERLAGLPVRVHSLGTLDLGPVAPLPEALELAAGFGLDLAEHRARCLLGHDLSAADLVVGFERDHVVKAVVEAGARRERAFTLPELLGYLDELGPQEANGPLEAARGAIAAAHRFRTERGLRAAELHDPIGGPAARIRESALTIRELAGRLADALFLQTAATSR